jgi:hypothetical protein
MSIENYHTEPIIIGGETICYNAAQLKQRIAHWQTVIKNMPPGKISDKDLAHLKTLPEKFEHQLKILQAHESAQ